MSEEARELAELLGPTAILSSDKPIDDGSFLWKVELLGVWQEIIAAGTSEEAIRIWLDNSVYIKPNYDTDINAMRPVWTALKEQNKWKQFLTVWGKEQIHDDQWADALFSFLNDLPGQVQAAIKTLRSGGVAS